MRLQWHESGWEVSFFDPRHNGCSPEGRILSIPRMPHEWMLASKGSGIILVTNSGELASGLYAIIGRDQSTFPRYNDQSSCRPRLQLRLSIAGMRDLSTKRQRSARRMAEISSIHEPANKRSWDGVFHVIRGPKQVWQ